MRGAQPRDIVDAQTLAEALAREAAGLCCGSMQEHVRLRAGRNWQQLFSSDSFQGRLASAQADAMPFCLVWVARAARLAGQDLQAAMQEPDAGALRRFDLKLAETARETLVRLPLAPGTDDAVTALAHLSAGQPADLRSLVSERGAARFLALMPIDPPRRDDDVAAVRNVLRLALAGSHSRFMRRLDVSGVGGIGENSAISGSPAAC
jgi:hypothetical protein